MHVWGLFATENLFIIDAGIRCVVVGFDLSFRYENTDPFKVQIYY